MLMQPDSPFPEPLFIDSLIEKAHNLRHLDTRQALKISQQARDLAMRIDYHLGLAGSLYMLSLCHHILADQQSPEIMETAEQAARLFENLKDAQGAARAYNLIANIHHRQNRYTEAFTYYNKSLILRRESGDQSGVAGSLNNIALIYIDVAQYADALENLYQCLEIAEASGDKRSAAYALANIAKTLIEMGNPLEARGHVLRALKMNHGSGDRAFDGTLFQDLGKLEAELGERKASMRHLRHSLEIARQIGNRHDEGLAVFGLGWSLQHFKQYTRARKVLHEALEIITGTAERSTMAHVLQTLGENELKQEHYVPAIEYLVQALEIATEVQSQQLSAKIHQLLSQAYEHLGDLHRALNHFKEYDATWRHIYSQETSRRVEALLARAEIVRAQQDAEIQRQKSNELSRKLSVVEAADKQKEELLKKLALQAEMLEQLAREDGLTGIFNRRWLDIQITREFERARRFNHPLSIAILDLDNFKKVNDTFSHLVGDQVLRATAKLLREYCRSVDVIGRYGGEEFMIILVETSQEQARAICEKLCRGIEAYPWDSILPQLSGITASIGLSNNAGQSTPEKMVAAADEQLYRAKRTGKNLVCGPE